MKSKTDADKDAEFDFFLHQNEPMCVSKQESHSGVQKTAPLACTTHKRTGSSLVLVCGILFSELGKREAAEKARTVDFF